MTDRLWRIGIWCAVSTKPQATPDKESLPEQQRLGREFAHTVKGEVVAVYMVPGHSRDLWRWDEVERKIPAYRQLREDIEHNKLDVLWAVDIDRLGRKAALQQQVLSLVEEDGDGEVYLESSPHELGKKGISQRYIESFQGVRTVEEQKERIRRHHMGMKGRIERRGLLPGSPPFYLDPVREPTTGRVVAYQFSPRVGALDLITDLYLRGISLAEISRRLNRSHHQPPRKAKHWWTHVIWETVHSDVPAGYAKWGKYQSLEPSDKIPARWDKETHEAIVKERQRRKIGYHRRGASPLAGVAFCARCGHKMGRNQAKGMPGPYLRCARHASKNLYPQYACHPNNTPESQVLAEVGAFLEWLTTEDALDQVLSALDEGAEIQQMEQELDQAQKTIQDLQQAKVRAGHAFAAGDMEISVYRQVNDDLSDQLFSAQSTAQELARTLEAVPDLEERRVTLEELRETFPQLLEAKEEAEISAILQNAGVRVYIEERKVRLIRIE